MFSNLLTKFSLNQFVDLLLKLYTLDVTTLQLKVRFQYNNLNNYIIFLEIILVLYLVNI